MARPPRRVSGWSPQSLPRGEADWSPRGRSGRSRRPEAAGSLASQGSWEQSSLQSEEGIGVPAHLGSKSGLQGGRIRTPLSAPLRFSGGAQTPSSRQRRTHPVVTALTGHADSRGPRKLRKQGQRTPVLPDCTTAGRAGPASERLGAQDPRVGERQKCTSRRTDPALTFLLQASKQCF